jgi:hypothetical protein
VSFRTKITLKNGNVVQTDEFVRNDGEQGEAMQSALCQLFDAYAPRLSDSNSKVNLHALEAFRRFLPKIKDAFGPNASVVVQIVNKLATNLASKSQVCMVV